MREKGGVGTCPLPQGGRRVCTDPAARGGGSSASAPRSEGAAAWACLGFFFKGSVIRLTQFPAVAVCFGLCVTKGEENTPGLTRAIVAFE